jgi:UDP-N-acetylglucosamine acyltransferase
LAIHPLAQVHPKARLAADVEIGPFAVVGPEVELGAGVELMPHAVVLGPTVLGPGCRVFPHAVLGCEPQDLKFGGGATRLVVGARNTFREGCTVHRGTDAAGLGETRLGDDNLLMAQSHIAHDVVLGDGCVLANSAAVAGHAQLGDGVILGGLVGIHQRARLGRLAFAAAGAMVSQDVPPFCMAQGDRARLVGLNLVGLRRAGMDRELIGLLKRAWQLLGDRSQPRVEILEAVLALAPERAELHELVDFVAGSKRGLCRPGRGDTDGARP